MRWKRSNSLGMASTGMPTPVSRTRSSGRAERSPRPVLLGYETLHRAREKNRASRDCKLEPTIIW